MEKNQTTISVNKITQTFLAEVLVQYFEFFYLAKFEIVERGYENVSIIIKVNKNKYVMRIYNRYQFGKHKRTEQSIALELDIIEYIRKKGVPVPKIIRTLDNKKLLEIKVERYKYFVVLTEYVKGRHLKRLTDGQEKEILFYQALMHKYLRNFNTKHKRSSKDQFGFEKFVLKHYKEKSGKKIKHGKIPDDLNDIILSLYPKLTELIKRKKKIPIHNDIHKDNLKFYGGKISGIFDFDDVLMGVSCAELGKTLFFIGKEFSKPELLDAKINDLLDYYSKTNKLSKKEIWIVKMTFVLSWAAHKLFFFNSSAKDTRVSQNCLRYYKYLKL